MSQSLHVVGIRPPDEKFEKMKAVWDSCKAAGVPIPEEVESFFEHEFPDESGVVVDIQYEADTVCVTRYEDEMKEGFEVDLTELPADITILRFYVSY